MEALYIRRLLVVQEAKGQSQDNICTGVGKLETNGLIVSKRFHGRPSSEVGRRLSDALSLLIGLFPLLLLQCTQSGRWREHVR